MKKFKLLALAFVIGSASLFAANVENPEELNKKIRSEIVSLLQSSDFIIENEMTVTLTFTFSSNGEIVVLCAGCKDRAVVDYIRKNLNYKKFENPGLRDKVYKMPLKFKAA
jgi:hypothetical protein